MKVAHEVSHEVSDSRVLAHVVPHVTVRVPSEKVARTVCMITGVGRRRWMLVFHTGEPWKDRGGGGGSG